MRQIQKDLWETETESPFPGLTTHAYLLTRDSGNLLFYNTGHRHEIEAMAGQGGVAYQFLSHQDELGNSILTIRERFGARLGGHIRERDKFAAICPPDILFERREVHLGNIEVIPTPGHTPGSTCFLVASPTGNRYLFTGDTLYLDGEGQWRAGYIEGYSDRASLATSLTWLAELEPDVVLSSAFGAAGFQQMASGDWRKYVETAAQALMS